MSVFSFFIYFAPSSNFMSSQDPTPANSSCVKSDSNSTAVYSKDGATGYQTHVQSVRHYIPCQLPCADYLQVPFVAGPLNPRASGTNGNPYFNAHIARYDPPPHNNTTPVGLNDQNTHAKTEVECLLQDCFHVGHSRGNSMVIEKLLLLPASTDRALV